MNSTDKFIVWSDGSFTSIGVEVSDGSLRKDSNRYCVKDPVAVIFTTSQTVNEETNEVESHLNFDMVPYFFGALLSEGENIWEVEARHVLKNSNISPALKNTYYHTIATTNHAKRDTNGEVIVTPNK